MSLKKLHEELLANADYGLAYAEEDLIHRVALRVLQFREASGFSQADLADLLGTKQPAIARIEAGEENLTLRRVARLAYALGYDPENLVARECPEIVELEWDYELDDATEYSMTMVSDAADALSYGAANNELAEAA